MNSLIHLMTIIGTQQTLIITCGQSLLRDYAEISNRVTVFMLPENTLQRYDAREKEKLQRAVEASGCTQIILLGVLDESMESLLYYHVAHHSLRRSMRFITPLLPACQELVPASTRAAALLEQHVAVQCGYLMQYHFIASKVKNRSLQIRGIVEIPHSEHHKTVFCNGARFNDYVSMN